MIKLTYLTGRTKGLPLTINPFEISYLRPHIDNDIWNGTMIYLKDNAKPVIVEEDYNELDKLLSVHREFYCLLKMMSPQKIELLKSNAYSLAN